jgi:hypothetical protein
MLTIVLTLHYTITEENCQVFGKMEYDKTGIWSEIEKAGGFGGVTLF